MMADIANRRVKRFHQHPMQITFAYAEDSQATTLMVVMNAPSGRTLSLALDQWQTRELTRWLQEQQSIGEENTCACGCGKETS